MKMSKYLFFFLGVVGLVTSRTNVFGQQQTGCLFNSRLYYTPNGTSGGFPNYNTNPNILLTSAFCVVNIGGTCRVNKKSNQQGTLRTFYLTPCPIDDYVPLLILGVGGFTFLMLRQKKLTTA